MKLEIFLIGSDGARTPVWSDENYKTSVKGSASALLNEAVSFALTTVFAPYFNGPFGISYLPISASAGVLKQRVKCSGRSTRLVSDEKGVMVPVEDNSSPDREFEVELRLDASSLKLKSLSGVRLKKIKICNLRSLKSIEINFREGSNLLLLAGLNGSGKTSVLEAIAHVFLKRLSGAEIRPLPDQDYNIVVNFLDGEKNEYIVEKTPSMHILKDGRGTVCADTDYELRRLFADINVLAFMSWRMPQKIRRPIEARSRSQRNAIENLRVECVKEYINSVLKPDEKPKGYLKMLNAAWRRFYPEDDSEFTIAEDGSSRSKEAPGELTFDLLLTGRRGSRYVPLDELSSGELELLSFMSDLMMLPSDILLIDEPELHLNRVWHKTVLNVITNINSRCQFIVATHAPEIWESVYSWDKVFLSDGEVSHG